MENHIDLAYIQEVACGDQEMVKELISDVIALIEETETIFPKLLQSQDFIGIANAAHKLKAPIQMVGATVFYEKIEEMERTAKSIKIKDDLIPIYNAFEALSQNCKKRLKDEIGN